MPDHSSHAPAAGPPAQSHKFSLAWIRRCIEFPALTRVRLSWAILYNCVGFSLKIEQSRVSGPTQFTHGFVVAVLSAGALSILKAQLTPGEPKVFLSSPLFDRQRSAAESKSEMCEFNSTRVPRLTIHSCRPIVDGFPVTFHHHPTFLKKV